ncbi:hypothetical protein PQR12_23465 [Paraburkholderia nemoris]|uniref:hypothetical protein n=1 Tax=Paraburkholderia nemoris TaxID=2793076 RepID=UPI0038BA2940
MPIEKSDELATAINVCVVSSHYAEMFRSLSDTPALTHQGDERAISKALYFHLAKIKHAGWRHRVDFRRGRKHSIADVFQDLVAFYLRCVLTARGMEVQVEPSFVGKNGKRIQPDIAVWNADEVVCVIEVKTTIGFARPNRADEDMYRVLRERLKVVADAAKIPEENAFYIFEEPANVTPEFRDAFWDIERRHAKSRNGLGDVLSRIYPLFWGTDPYYWPWPSDKNNAEEQRDKARWCPEISDERFLAEAESRLVTPLEDVINRIIAMTPVATSSVKAMSGLHQV